MTNNFDFIETNNADILNVDNNIMINPNNNFVGSGLIAILGLLIILGCLLPLLKLKRNKQDSNLNTAPLQQTATLIK